MRNPLTAYIERRVEQALSKAVEQDVHVRALLERKGYVDNESQYSPENREDYLMTYERYVWVYAAVYAIASSAGKVPLRMYKLQPNQQRGEEILQGRVWDLFYRPNPFQSYYDIMEAILSSMELSGSAYIEKGGDEVQPIQLYVLRPDWVEVVPSPKTLIAGYRYKVNGQYINYTSEEVCNIKYYHPRSELYGLSPIGPSMNSMLLDFYTIRYQKNFFKQGAMMNTYVTVPKSLGEKEFQRFKEQLRADYQGVDRAHMIGVFDNDAQLKELGTDPQKFLLKDQRSMNRDEVLAAFGVPPVMVGLLDSATFNNTGEQKKAFWENTMTPKLKKLEDKFNQEFFWPLQMECEFDLKSVPALQEDSEKKANTAVKLVSGGVFTPNEAREEFYNKKPIEGGDELKPIAPPAATGLMASASPFPVTKSGMTRLEKAKAEFIQDYSKYIGEYDRAMRKSFTAMSNKLVSKIKAGYKSPSLKKNDLVNEAFNNLDEETVGMMDDLVALNEDVMMETAMKKYSSVKNAPAPRLVRSKARQAASKNAQDWAKKSSSSIVTTMKDRVGGFMDKAIKEDMSIENVTAGVQEIFQGTARDAFPWARAIARTETSKAVNSGKLEGMKAAGIKYKEWIAADGPTGRPEHTALGEIGPVPIDYEYETSLSKMQFPGDENADVGDLVNCRCTITESLAGPEEGVE